MRSVSIREEAMNSPRISGYERPVRCVTEIAGLRSMVLDHDRRLRNIEEGA